MNEVVLRRILNEVESGNLAADDALKQLQSLPYALLREARFDHHRELRRGFPEVILGEGKTPEQVADILFHAAQHHNVILCTRATPDQHAAAKERVPQCHYDPKGRVLFCAPERWNDRGRGRICVVAAGTADLNVAREAWWTAALMGNSVDFVMDVGIAGLQRVLSVMEQLQQAEILIVVAGMEGALPSVLGGLCDRPIIGVPTSIGYGSGKGGWPALLSMLNSCVAGISVVNINNGFGAGYAASLINRLRETNDESWVELEPLLQQADLVASSHT